MKAKDKTTSPDLADHMGKVVSQSQGHCTNFLRKFQDLRSLPSFPFIVAVLGYVALFILFIIWRVTR